MDENQLHVLKKDMNGIYGPGYFINKAYNSAYVELCAIKQADLWITGLQPISSLVAPVCVYRSEYFTLL